MLPDDIVEKTTRRGGIVLGNRIAPTPHYREELAAAARASKSTEPGPPKLQLPLLNPGAKVDVLGIQVNATDYDRATEAIIRAAVVQRPYAVSALAVHGVMTGVLDPVQRFRLNKLDLVTPDGQPVRWAMNLLHGAGLRDRVYGPNLTLAVCERAALEGLPIFLYGSKRDTLEALAENLTRWFPGLRIAGARASAFRQLSEAERWEVARDIRESGARIVLVGLGCPRQEVWVYEMRKFVSLPMLAVGAAFDFHSGRASQAPPWMQRRGLEWLYRLAHNPLRLWRRYLLLNPYYLVLISLQRLGLRVRAIRASSAVPPREDVRVG